MATTSMWRVNGWLGKLVVYVENPEKTNNPKYFEKAEMTSRQTQGLADVIEYAVNTQKTSAQANDEAAPIMRQFVSGVNCSPATARDTMTRTKQEFGKTDGTVAYHGYQSFAPGEADPDMAHEIGIKLAAQLWGDRYQVLVATHLDKSNHLHNHFVINTVSFMDGIKFHRTEKDYYDMQKASDELCREYGLSVIENPKRGKSRQYGEWRAEREGKPTWRSLIKADVDKAIAESMTDRQFFYHLRNQGYEIKMGKDISVKPQGKERFFRLARNFGEDYTLDGICKQILAHSRPKPPLPVPQNPPITAILHGNLKTAKKMGDLRGLYLYYCYRIGALPKNRQSPARVHFLYREDIRKMETISKEARLLCKYRIDTQEQLSSYKDGLASEIGTLTADRKRLRGKARGIKDDGELTNVKSEITAISKRLSELRKEVKLCDGIAARSGEMKDKIRRVNEDEKSQGKELKNLRERS